ncbi:putative pathogenesis-related protein [Nymphaea thermarum]|nr:putative pathogenesis-related protein [Nymphaea thermarum]
MKRSAGALVWVCLLLGLGILIHGTHAQNSPQDFLAPHNAARAEVGVGPMSWDDEVAAYARDYANQRIGDCNLEHSGGGQYQYGENIFKGSGPGFNAADAVSYWVSEKSDYDYSTNTCASGRVCGHYTQVVWRNSVRLGCARVECDNGGTFITCNYDPAGNPMERSSGALVWICLLLHLGMLFRGTQAQDFVAAHNAARAKVGVGPMVWDLTVATYAQKYANQRIGDCRLVHSGGPYGENLFWGSGRDYTAADAVNWWMAEASNYDYATNTCASGKVCGHYTKVVWRKSVRLGCARVKCNSGAIFITCNYDPPGNIIGQRPY